MRLELIEVYYIRRLLRQNLDRLESVVVKGGGPSIDPLSDLNDVVEQLYLEEDQVQAVLTELQQLEKLHQSLSSGSHLNRYRLREVESRIFWLLGLKEKKPGHQELVLVVDDQAINLKLLKAFLTHQGYHVKTVNNGEEAIEQAIVLKPDVILLDIWMPMMDGFEICEKLKTNSLTDDIPVLFVTSNVDAQAKLKGFEVGGADYITRPFELEEVLARLEYQLKIRSLQKRLAAQNGTLQHKMQSQQTELLQYQQFFEHAVDGMYQVSASGQYIKVNMALANICGCSSVDEMFLAIQDDVTALYVDSDRHSQFITSIKETGRIFNFESQVYRADKSIIWIAESARMAYDDNGIFSCYEGTVRDITQYKS